MGPDRHKDPKQERTTETSESLRKKRQITMGERVHTRHICVFGTADKMLIRKGLGSQWTDHTEPFRSCK